MRHRKVVEAIADEVLFRCTLGTPIAFKNTIFFETGMNRLYRFRGKKQARRTYTVVGSAILLLASAWICCVRFT